METATLLIDRPGNAPALVAQGTPMVDERPGDPCSPVWILCDIELASGRSLLGAVRVTPPQRTYGAPKVSRLTGVLAIVGRACVDLLSGSERVRAGLAACETIPLRLRLLATCPYATPGFDPRDPRLPLERGLWTRLLQPVDLAEDVTKLAPMAWRR